MSENTTCLICGQPTGPGHVLVTNGPDSTPYQPFNNRVCSSHTLREVILSNLFYVKLLYEPEDS